MMQDQELNLLAAEFFRVFARAEYALKASGFNQGNGPAEPNWTKFAVAIEAFIANPPNEKIRQAIEFIMNEPPKKQFITDDIIEWREVKPSTNSQSDALFQYIRRIRNNLFHGGKFNGYWFAPDRSERLMRAALTVLSDAIEQDSKVREAYHG
jgi:hypothetical protein